jgi:putative FmdB family regulatory protein
VPTYQYACTECGHGFEQFQSFSDDALTECPTCGGRLRKVFNSVGIVFKGSGFYRNDSREAAAKAKGKDNKDSRDKEPVGSAKSDSSSDKSSETKSDKQSDRQSDGGNAGSDKKSDSAAASAGASSGKGSGSSGSGGSSSGGSSSGSSSTAGSAA